MLDAFVDVNLMAKEEEALSCINNLCLGTC